MPLRKHHPAYGCILGKLYTILTFIVCFVMSLLVEGHAHFSSICLHHFDNCQNHLFCFVPPCIGTHTHTPKCRLSQRPSTPQNEGYLKPSKKSFAFNHLMCVFAYLQRVCHYPLSCRVVHCVAPHRLLFGVARYSFFLLY